MSPAARALAVGTRGSPLALAQTEGVIAQLRARHPELRFEVRRITTKGDVMRDVPLASMGGQGVFADAIEEALAAGEIDLAVHSAKDLPSITADGLSIAAYPEREDARDVLVSHAGDLNALPYGARVGTSSQRRACQLLAARPDLRVRDLRGNVDTRLRKLDEDAYDAIVLAGAGLIRLGLTTRIIEWLPANVMIPAPGQGALAIEVRSGDLELHRMLAPLSHQPTVTALAAERAFLACLGAGCSAALAAFATVSATGHVSLQAMIGAPDGRCVRGERTAPASGAAALGSALAAELLDRGGRELIPALQRAGS
ncbi:MAG TPA: hydroxymethylbilane synthase [Gemmatimonadaceae bacterium]|nr:hydroxymethylbilane synthase [Gemmatimonadaceae bacterium]